MKEIVFTAHDLEATGRLGAALAACLAPGSTVGLCGTLGAGKTYLVKAIAAASGIAPEDVTSPTFVICREYRGKRLLYHLDAYRIRDEDEFLELGPEEYFDSGGITFVEWADRVPACLPADRLEIHIEPLGPSTRQFRIRATGERNAGILARLRDSLAS